MNQEEIINVINSTSWHKIGNWTVSVPIMDLCLRSVQEKNLKILKIPTILSGFLIVGHDWYFREEEYQKLLNYYKNKIQESSTYIGWFAQTLDATSNEALKTVERSSTLKELFEAINQVITQGVIMLPLDEAIHLYLSENSFDEELFLHIFPLRDSEMVKEAKELLRLKISGEKEEELLRHRNTYGWMKTINWEFDQYTVDYYKKRLSEISVEEAKEKLKALEKDYEEEITSYLADKDQQHHNVVRDIRALLDAKMFNWDVVGMSNSKVRELIRKELPQLHYAEAVQLSARELLEISAKKMSFEQGKKLAAKREGDLLGFSEGSRAHIGKLAGYKDKLHLEEERKDVLKGLVAYKGKVQGPASIIMNIRDIHKVKEGHILVCPMTNPDYMPAIEKCAGIVTDEGGILCHASIISREFHKPCVVATKVATKSFVDGDLVEVDADNGVVRKREH